MRSHVLHGEMIPSKAIGHPGSCGYSAAMRPPATQLRKAATRFLEGQPPISHPHELTDLISRCAVHLVGVGRLDGAEARDLAVAAWAEISAREARCFVDLELSSPHLIYLMDGVTGRRRAIPVIDLVRWLGPRQVPAPDRDAPG